MTHKTPTTMTTQLQRLPILTVVSSSIAAAVVAVLVYTMWFRQQSKQRGSNKQVEHAAGRPQLDCYNDATARQQVLDSALERAVTTSPPALQEHLSKIGTSRTPLANQLGGLGSNKAPILSIPNFILKPVQLKNYRGFREVAFYESLQLARRGQHTLDEAIHAHNDDSTSTAASPPNTATNNRLAEIRLLQNLSHFTADFHGVVALASNSPQQPDYFIILQDMTVTFHNPNVMDLKLGTQTFEPDASPEKKQREASKYKHQGEFGFRLVGMRKYDTGSNKYQTWDKMHGRSLTTREAVVATFQEFFAATPEQLLCQDQMARILNQVESLQEWFDENNVLSFFSSSILIVYDETGVALLRMVDFGHVRRGHGGDEGYKVGLETVSSIFRELLGLTDVSSILSELLD
jgi:1D-myo-inositol-tetrakisphosphate 5-kinase/inositol-polyphosphate multikinase